MATVNYAVVPSKIHGDNWRQVTWTPLVAANVDGLPFQMPALSNRTVEVHGTFDGATVTIQGSNDNATWYTLVDPQGNPLTFASADRIETILDVPLYTRPFLSGGAGAQSLTVIMVCSK